LARPDVRRRRTPAPPKTPAQECRPTPLGAGGAVRPRRKIPIGRGRSVRSVPRRDFPATPLARSAGRGNRRRPRPMSPDAPTPPVTPPQPASAGRNAKLNSTGVSGR